MSDINSDSIPEALSDEENRDKMKKNSQRNSKSFRKEESSDAFSSSEMSEQDISSSKTSSEDYSYGDSIPDIDFDAPDPLEVIPPDFDLARKHCEANCVKDMRYIDPDANHDDPNYFCQCCNHPLDKAAKKYSLLSGPKDLSSLGATFALYFPFKFIVLMICLLMTIVLTTGGILLLKNRGEAAEWNPNEEVAFISSLSLGNIGKCDNCSDSNLNGIIWLNIGVFVILIFAWMCFSDRQKRAFATIGFEKCSASDFTALVTNIPKDKTEEEVKERFSNLLNGFDVEYVNFCYDFTKQHKLIQDMNKYKKQRNIFQHYREVNESVQKNLSSSQEDSVEDGNAHFEEEPFILPPPPIIYLTSSLGTIEEEIDALDVRIEQTQEAILKEEPKFLGKAFVVFGKSNDLQKMVNFFRVAYWYRIYLFVKHKIFRCRKPDNVLQSWDGKRIYLERAAHPQDIFWENLSGCLKEKYFRNCVTYITTLLCLGASFGLTLGISYWKESITNQENTSAAEDFFITLLSILSSLLVTIINIILEVIIRALCKFENHITYTKFNISVSLKLTLATFINTGMLPLFVNFGTKNWFHSNGLMNEIFYNMLSICFISPLFYLFDHEYIIKLVRMRIEESKGERSTLTQREANRVFEPLPVDMAKRYSETMLVLFMVAMYSYILPITPLIGTLGLSLQTLIEKYLLLRRHKHPAKLGKELPNIFWELLLCMIAIYGLSIVFFNNVLFGTNSLFFVLMIGGCVFFMASVIFNWVTTCRRREGSFLDLRYSDHYLGFSSDYDRENPFTRKDAWKEFINLQRKFQKIRKSQKTAHPQNQFPRPLPTFNHPSYPQYNYYPQFHPQYHQYLQRHPIYPPQTPTSPHPYHPSQTHQPLVQPPPVPHHSYSHPHLPPVPQPAPPAPQYLPYQPQGHQTNFHNISHNLPQTQRIT